MSAAVRTTSFPSAAGLAIVAGEYRVEKVRSNTPKKTRYFAKRDMEAPFGMRESYNIPRRQRKNAVAVRPETSRRQDQDARSKEGQSCDILRARLRDCTKGRMRMLDRRNF